MTTAGSSTREDELSREIEKLRKINAVLIDRVERSTDAHGSAFSLFQRATTLEMTVRQRTAELQALNGELQDAKSEADRANVGKTKFLAGAGHDLLQPLNVARLFLDALGERERDAETVRIVERIGTALETAESLISTILEISKLDAGALPADIADVAIGPLLRRLASEYAIEAEDRHLRFRLVAFDAVVRTDLRLLERVLRNLISNALRYTKRGGILLGCRHRRGSLRIAVWDTGAGIPADRLEDIFEEFRRLDVPGHDKDGMGLGLAIVERIAKLLALEVTVRSSLGRGSMFAVDVPLGDPAFTEPSDIDSKRPPAAVTLGGRSVLVVDDDARAREALALVLRGWGCDVLEAATPSQAVALATDGARQPDAIVADFHLGESLTGLDAIASVRAGCGSALPAVVISADRDDATKAEALAGGHWFLPKPVRVDRLRSLLNHLFA